MGMVPGLMVRLHFHQNGVPLSFQGLLSDQVETTPAISLVMPLFGRGFVLHLGHLVSNLSDPGSVLDRFIGRWVDHVQHGKYRITPLLRNEASKTWTQQKISETHSRIFESFARSEPITANEFGMLYLHAYISKNSKQFEDITIHAILLEQDDFVQISPSLHFIVFMNKGAVLKGFDPEISMVFRRLQYRVAVQEVPDELCRLAQEWLEESKCTTCEQRSDNLKYVMHFTIASTYEAPLPPKLVVNSILQFRLLHLKIGGSADIKLPQSPFPFNKNIEKISQVVATFFMLFVPKCTNIAFFEEILQAIAELKGEERADLFDAEKDGYFEFSFYFLTQTIWLNESQKEDADYQRLKEVLLRSTQLGEEWKIDSLQVMATRVLAIIYDENLGDSDLAIQTLSTACEKYQKNEILVAQLANTYFRKNEYEQAVDIWYSVLLGDRSSDFLYDSYLYRNAGIAAATIGKFDLASAFFARGALLKDPDIPAHLQCGFWVDAAFALFFAQDYEKMLHYLALAADMLFEHRSENEFKWKTQRRLAAYAIMWMNQQVDGRLGAFERPPFGICSNASPHEGLQSLPDTPAISSIFFITTLEDSFSQMDDIFNKYNELICSSEIQPFEFQAFSLAIKKSFRSFLFRELPQLINLWRTSANKTAKIIRESPSTSTEEITFLTSPIEIPVHCVLNAALALWGLKGENPLTLLDRWNCDKDVCSLPEILEITALWRDISLAQAQNWVVDEQAESVQRQVAVAFILSQQSVSPTYAFWAQAGLFFLFNSLITRDCLGASLPMIVNSISMSWEAYSEEPALLKTPKLSVPEILAAVASDTPPLEKLILLLEAGSFATGVRLPVGWRDILCQLLN